MTRDDSGGPLRVALTGGIATGKSHCLGRFAALGVPVIDADVLAREAVRRGTPGLAAVTARFGPSVLQADGDLNRQALAQVVFANDAARAALEAIIHPAVYTAIDRWFATTASRQPLAIADVPLLYETARAPEFDRVIVATCPPDEQRRRLIARGLTLVEANRRMDSQLPTSEKTSRADYVIDTTGTIARTNRRVIEIWEKLRAEAATPGPSRR